MSPGRWLLTLAEDRVHQVVVRGCAKSTAQRASCSTPLPCPGRFRIGDLGPGAREFIDFLAEARQGLWQVLPLGPTGYGDSRYQSLSAFAGNHLLVSPELLSADDWLDEEDLSTAPEGSMDAIGLRAVSKPRQSGPARRLCRSTCEHSAWLEDYCLFILSIHRPEGAPWWCHVDRLGPSTGVLRSVGLVEWADASQPGSGRAAVPIAGVPPVYFSTTGQRWENPL